MHGRALGLIQALPSTSTDAVIALAISAISALGGAPAKPSACLGAPLATGEEPLAQACVVYAVQAAVVRNLPEAGLRNLLEALRGRAAALLPAAPPLPAAAAPEAVALLTVMSRSLSAVGEVTADDAQRLRDTVHKLLIASPPAVSRAAAGVLGQLAAVDGSSAASLMMDYLSLVTLQTASLGSQSGARHGAALPLLPASAGGAHLSYNKGIRSETSDCRSLTYRRGAHTSCTPLCAFHSCCFEL